MADLEINELNQASRNDLANTAGFEYVIQTVNSAGATIADHSDSAIVGSAAWAIAQINARPLSADRAGTIKYGRGTFPFLSLLRSSDRIAHIGSGVESTTLDFQATAGGLEMTNAVIHSSSRVNVIGDYVYPLGAWPFSSRFRCIVAGTSGTAASFNISAQANATIGDTFVDGGATWEAVANVPMGIAELSYNMANTMTGTGLAFRRTNDIYANNLRVTGGNATIGSASTALEIDACNRFMVGGGKMGFFCFGNGVKVSVQDTTTFPYNFGDGYFTNIDMTLQGAAIYGMLLESPDISNEVINNIMISRMEMQGSGNVADCQVGVWLHAVARNTIKHFDCERINVAIMETGNTFRRAQDNVIEQLHHINTGQQDTEKYTYARGIPFSTGALTPYTEVVIRENWLQHPRFANEFPSGTTLYIADEDGSWGRDIASISVPAGGLITCTLASNSIPTSGRDSIARHPVLTLNGFHAINTKIEAGGLGLLNFFQLAGRFLSFGRTATNNYIAPIFRASDNVAYDLELVNDRLATANFVMNADGTLTIVVGNITTGNITTLNTVTANISSAMQLTPLAAAPTSAPSLLAVSDGTGSGFDGASGAGLYVRNAANSAWVFIG